MSEGATAVDADPTPNHTGPMPEIAISRDGETTIPLDDVVTGRGFLTGKSGSGKSNSAAVLVEEVLRRGIPALIVDADGEYVSLKDEFEVLHAGAGPDADVVVDASDSPTIARTALAERVPVILDTSDFSDRGVSEKLVEDTLLELFLQEKREQFPFLVVLEECHEYVPERGGPDVKDVVIKIAKRGRKRGLGIIGLSQRPADVAKAFITQADWLAWHRLTWPNDTAVVKDVLDADAADTVTSLDDGESLVVADWFDDVRRVQWRRKDTPDLGESPDVRDALGTTPDRIDDTVLDGFYTGDELPECAVDYLEDLRDELSELSERQLAMLAYFHEHDDERLPAHEAHAAAGGSLDASESVSAVRDLLALHAVERPRPGGYTYSLDDHIGAQFAYNPKVTADHVDAIHDVATSIFTDGGTDE